MLLKNKWFRYDLLKLGQKRSGRIQIRREDENKKSAGIEILTNVIYPFVKWCI